MASLIYKHLIYVSCHVSLIVNFSIPALYPVGVDLCSRLALLYSTATFVSTEAFRRAALGVTERNKWRQAINLAWIRYCYYNDR